MQIGKRIKRMRLEMGLTQEELADRSELTKGYISQIEHDLSSPSIATLVDLLEALGTTLSDFFNEQKPEKIVFSEDDWFEKVDDEYTIDWVIPNAQKNEMEPIIITLKPGMSSPIEASHYGEEFGFVLAGNIELTLGTKKYKVKRGETFYFNANDSHHINNLSQHKEAKVLWVCTPPSF